jgi:hypothetical protein
MPELGGSRPLIRNDAVENEGGEHGHPGWHAFAPNTSA